MVSPIQKQQDIIITVYQRTFHSTVKALLLLLWNTIYERLSKNREPLLERLPYRNPAASAYRKGLQSCNLLFYLCRLFP